MHDASEILISAERIAARVRALGEELSRAYAGREPVVVAIMKGSLFFLTDLVRAWPGPMDLEFVSSQSYVGTQPGDVRLSLPPDFVSHVAGRHVLILDDIYDTGATLAAVCLAVRALGPADVRTLVLLRKRRAVRTVATPPCPPDWIGFDIDDRFVVGYGLDYHGRYRNLPHIAALRVAD